jgi:hypothetical protein
MPHIRTQNLICLQSQSSNPSQRTSTVASSAFINTGPKGRFSSSPGQSDEGAPPWVKRKKTSALKGRLNLRAPQPAQLPRDLLTLPPSKYHTTTSPPESPPFGIQQHKPMLPPRNPNRLHLPTRRLRIRRFLHRLNDSLEPRFRILFFGAGWRFGIKSYPTEAEPKTLPELICRGSAAEASAELLAYLYGLRSGAFKKYDEYERRAQTLIGTEYDKDNKVRDERERFDHFKRIVKIPTAADYEGIPWPKP